MKSMNMRFFSSSSAKQTKSQRRSRGKSNRSDKFDQQRIVSFKEEERESSCILPDQMVVETRGSIDVMQHSMSQPEVPVPDSSKRLSSSSYTAQTSHFTINSDDYSTMSDDYSDSDTEYDDESEDELFVAGEVRTMNQNEFFIECMLNGTDLSIVHFYNDRSPVSAAWDKVLTRIAGECCTCRFLRIDGSSAPFITAKLNVQTLPTVLAINQEKIVHTLVATEQTEHLFGDDNASRLQDWVMQVQNLCQ